MDKELLLENIEMEAYSHGKAMLVAGICKKLNVTNIFDKYLTKQNGRKPDIAYGIMAQMMLANLCHSRRPLYLMDEYFEHIDIQGTFNSDAKPYNLTDDRFSCFLDNLHEAGPRKIFSEISMSAFATYGYINYDTTSKVIWGQYETEEGKIGEIVINYGYSKDKRNDKKQIKIGIGTANGIVIDAKVLENAQGKEVKYQVLDYKTEYKGIPVKLAVCYCFSLEETKRKTISRHAEKEYSELEKKMKQFSKRSFACEADSQKEIEEFLKTKGKN